MVDRRRLPLPITLVLCLLLNVAHASVCVVSFWTRWGPCIGNCEFGLQVRNRNVVRAPFPERTEDGRLAIRACPPLYQVQTCVPDPCRNGITDFSGMNILVPADPSQLFDGESRVPPEKVNADLEATIGVVENNVDEVPPVRIISTDVLDRTSKEIGSKPTNDGAVSVGEDASSTQAPEEEDSVEGSGEDGEETIGVTSEEKLALVTGQSPVLSNDSSTEIDDTSETFKITDDSSEILADKNATSVETSQEETLTTTEAVITTTTQRTTTTLDEVKRRELIEKAVREVVSEARDKNLAPNPTDIARAMRGQFDGAPCGAVNANPSCCRKPMRLRCDDGRMPQIVMRYYRNIDTDECVAYSYPYCSLEDESLDPPIKWEQDCYDLCFTAEEKRNNPVFDNLRYIA